MVNHVRQHVKGKLKMVLEDFNEITGGFFAGKGVKNAAQALDGFLDFARGPGLCPLKEKMFREMSYPGYPQLLIAGAHLDPNPHGHRIPRRHFRHHHRQTIGHLLNPIHKYLSSYFYKNNLSKRARANRPGRLPGALAAPSRPDNVLDELPCNFAKSTARRVCLSLACACCATHPFQSNFFQRLWWKSFHPSIRPEPRGVLSG